NPAMKTSRKTEADDFALRTGQILDNRVFRRMPSPAQTRCIHGATENGQRSVRDLRKETGPQLSAYDSTAPNKCGHWPLARHFRHGIFRSQEFCLPPSHH